VTVVVVAVLVDVGGGSVVGVVVMEAVVALVVVTNVPPSPPLPVGPSITALPPQAEAHAAAQSAMLATVPHDCPPTQEFRLLIARRL
jgi:hypothetical protein